MFEPAILLMVIVFCSVGIGFIGGRASSRGDLKDAEERIKELLLEA